MKLSVIPSLSRRGFSFCRPVPRTDHRYCSTVKIFPRTRCPLEPFRKNGVTLTTAAGVHSVKVAEPTGRPKGAMRPVRLSLGHFRRPRAVQILEKLTSADGAAGTFHWLAFAEMKPE